MDARTCSRSPLGSQAEVVLRMVRSSLAGTARALMEISERISEVVGAINEEVGSADEEEHF